MEEQEKRRRDDRRNVIEQGREDENKKKMVAEKKGKGKRGLRMGRKRGEEGKKRIWPCRETFRGTVKSGEVEIGKEEEMKIKMMNTLNCF